MSNDRRPGKVKLYSGSGAKPGQTEAAGQPGGGGPSGPAGSVALALPANPAIADGDKSGSPWLVLLLFLLGCILGGGLFTAFMPL